MLCAPANFPAGMSPTTFPAWEPQEFFRFEVVHQSAKSRARAGRIHTPRGIIDTPGFVPVGTNGAVSAVGSNHTNQH